MTTELAIERGELVAQNRIGLLPAPVTILRTTIPCAGYDAEPDVQDRLREIIDTFGSGEPRVDREAT
jgi:hypothetical protein